MGLSALSLFTHGWHHPGLVEVEVCEKPLLTAVVEVRPEIRATIPPPSVGPAGTPVVIGSSELKPVILDAEGPPPETTEDRPTVVSSTELRPVILDAEEE